MKPKSSPLHLGFASLKSREGTQCKFAHTNENPLFLLVSYSALMRATNCELSWVAHVKLSLFLQVEGEGNEKRDIVMIDQ